MPAKPTGLPVHGFSARLTGGLPVKHREPVVFDHRVISQSARNLFREVEGNEIDFYSCSVKFVDEPLAEVYDWRVDVIAEQSNDVI